MPGTHNPTDTEASEKKPVKTPVRMYDRPKTSTANYNDPIAGLGFET